MAKPTGRAWLHSLFLASFRHRPEAILVQCCSCAGPSQAFWCRLIDMFPFLASFWHRPEQSQCIFVVVPARPGILLQFYKCVSVSLFILAPPRAILVKFCSCPGSVLAFCCRFVGMFPFLASFQHCPEESQCIFVVVPARPIQQLYKYVSISCFIPAPPVTILAQF